MQPNRSNDRSRRELSGAEYYSEMLVEDLDIPDALARRLCRRGIITVGQLLTMSEADVRGYWIGEGSIRKIQAAIMAIGLEPLGRNAPRQTIRRII